MNFIATWSCPSATTCWAGASWPPPWWWMRPCACSPACWAMRLRAILRALAWLMRRLPPPGTAFRVRSTAPEGCWIIRTTPVRRSLAACASPRPCSMATTPGFAAGAVSSSCAKPWPTVRICWRELRSVRKTASCWRRSGGKLNRTVRKLRCLSRNIQLHQPLGQGHFDALRFDVNLPQEAFGEGDENLACRSMHHQQRHRAGRPVHALDFAHRNRLSSCHVDQCAADQVAGVDLVVGESGSLGARKAHDQPLEGFGG